MERCKFIHSLAFFQFRPKMPEVTQYDIKELSNIFYERCNYITKVNQVMTKLSKGQRVNQEVLEATEIGVRQTGIDNVLEYKATEGNDTATD